MSEHIHTFSTFVLDEDGRRYRVHAHGRESETGTWQGWLLFESENGDGTVLSTDRETTQPNRQDLEYWASGIEPVYLEGALVRALARAARAADPTGAPLPGGGPPGRRASS